MQWIAILSDRSNYQRILEIAKQINVYLPKRTNLIAIGVFTNFSVEGIFDDLFQLLSTLTGSMDIDEYVTDGVANIASPKDLKAIVAFGLDRYKGSKKWERYYVQICRSIARHAENGAEASRLNDLAELLKSNASEEIADFAKSIDHDGSAASRVFGSGFVPIL